MNTFARVAAKCFEGGRDTRMTKAQILRRRKLKKNRIIRDALGARNAAEAIGEVSPGCEIFGLFAGQWSLINILQTLLETTGPADVTISTWTASAEQINTAYRLLRDGRIRSLRFIVDFSFPARQPAYCKVLRARFGDEAIRITKNHAKLVLILNERWNLVVRTSANLNENRRLESFDLSDDPALAAYVLRVVDKLFAAESGAEAFGKRPGEHVQAFERGGLGAPLPALNQGPGPFDHDVMRGGGVSYL